MRRGLHSSTAIRSSAMMLMTPPPTMGAITTLVGSRVGYANAVGAGSGVGSANVDLGGDAERLRGSSSGTHNSRHNGHHTADKMYTIIREPTSVVDIRAWLGRGERGGSGGGTTPTAPPIEMEREARQQLGYLSQLTRKRVEQQKQQDQKLRGGGGDTSARLPNWMKSSGAYPHYPSSFVGHDDDILQHPIAVMPDVHFGNGTTVGTVLPTYKAIIPSAVGVDIGCGMLALKTSLRHADLLGNADNGSSGSSNNSILANLRMAIEIAIPHGRTHNGEGANDAGGWRANIPQEVADVWSTSLQPRFDRIIAKYPTIERSNNINHLGTLGTGNHFIEICIEEVEEDGTVNGNGNGEGSSSSAHHLHRGSSHLQSLHPSVFGGSNDAAAEAIDAQANHQREAAEQRGGHVWIMLHSGSRGVGSKIGSTFIDIAKKEMGQYYGNLPNGDLAYLREVDVVGANQSSSARMSSSSLSSSSSRSSSYFNDYCEALSWAQDYAKWNRELMAQRVIAALRATRGIPKDFTTEAKAVNCHHNYVERMDVTTCQLVPWEYNSSANSNNTANNHTNDDVGHVDSSNTNIVYLTRKGATSAQKGELAIIPGSMGARSFIVQGKGNTEAYCSCSHGAGRRYSRGESKRRFTATDHEAATAGVECRKDADVIDETPMAYKDIDAVIEAQRDLVDVVAVLKQVLCVKG